MLIVTCFSFFFSPQIHQVRRISKAKEFHMSDEEKKKRRKSRKVIIRMNIVSGLFQRVKTTTVDVKIT